MDVHELLNKYRIVEACVCNLSYQCQDGVYRCKSALCFLRYSHFGMNYTVNGHFIKRHVRNKPLIHTKKFKLKSPCDLCTCHLLPSAAIVGIKLWLSWQGQHKSRSLSTSTSSVLCV